MNWQGEALLGGQLMSRAGPLGDSKKRLGEAATLLLLKNSVYAWKLINPM